MSAFQPTPAPPSAGDRTLSTPAKARVALVLAGFYLAVSCFELAAEMTTPSTTALLRLFVPGVFSWLIAAAIVGLLVGLALLVVEYSGTPLVIAACFALLVRMFGARGLDLSVIAGYGLTFGLNGLLLDSRVRRYLAARRARRPSRLAV